MSKLSQRDNKLRAIRFQKPDYIPMIFHVNNASYAYYGKEYLYDFCGVSSDGIQYKGAKRIIRKIVPFLHEPAVYILFEH